MNQVMLALGGWVPGVGPVFAEKVEFGGDRGGCVVWKKARRRKMKNRIVQFGSSVKFVGVRAGLSRFYPSRLGLDHQCQESSRMLWIGPVPGDIAEVEAYCRIFRAAEQLHTATMHTVCNPETGECTVLPVLEEKLVNMLGRMLALLNREREEVLSGRSTLASSFRATDLGVLDDRLPPLALFRGEMKRCCESLHVALANYFTTFDDRITDIWGKLQRLRNVCYDAGFPRSEGYPSPTIFANWSPVCLSNKKEETTPVDCEIAFWKGGQVTDEGLDWLLEKGYKTIVDLRDGVINDRYYKTAIETAVSCGKIEVVSLPVKVGTAPSVEQVKKFALLVSDLSRRPIYLHSQEGVSRTSAMISRWRQYISRAVTPHTTQMKLNGKTKEDAMVHDKLELKKHKPSKKRINLQSDKSGLLLNEVDTNMSNHVMNTNHVKNDLTIQNENGSGQVTACSNNEVKDDLQLGYTYTKGLDPLKSQFPKGDIFSRREMTHFFKNKKVSPETYIDFQRKRLERSTSRQYQRKKDANDDTQISELMNSTVPNINSDPFSRHNGGYGDHGKHISDPNAFVLDSNEHHKKEIHNIAQPSTSSKASIDLNGQRQSVAVDEGNGLMSNGSSKSFTDNDDLVDGNMCASTTGVVRVQSRKKAEMFLVRTDGFSCAREKVTESSLAFTHPSTQQQMLMWKSSPKTVLLLKKLGKELMKETKEVASFLYHQEKMNVLVEPDVHDMFARLPGFGFIQTFYSQDTSDLHERVDFVACLGGDGVILHASNLFRDAVPPVVSFNLGSLGFLTTHTFEDYMKDLSALIHGNNTSDGVYITLRMRLRCEIFRNGKAMPGKVFDVLNEVVVDRGSNPYISKIECYEHGRLITKVQGDGVIVATPTGSTAYSTAAGGSMVHPNVPCMLFTPICPHSLSFRPVILPDSAQLELKIPKDARSNAWVSFDGKRRQQLSRGDSVKICMSQHPLPTVNKFDQTGDWFRSLIRCLNWNERLEQRAL